MLKENLKSVLIYLASPYTHPERQVEIDRFEATEAVTAKLLKAGFNVYSPIVYAHQMAERYQFPTDAAYWEKFNSVFFNRCGHLVILCLPGWTSSKGIVMESDWAVRNKIGITYLEHDYAAPAQE